jgi:D-alanyl-D-alanine-carboxypeptidase/D-alanyl-D-alanine-endopeptidase
VAGWTLVHAAGVGVADVATSARPGSATVFRIASMTKSFTALCVLALRDEGLLALVDHVPSWERCATRRRTPLQ